jgi:hypothetical protein
MMFGASNAHPPSSCQPLLNLVAGRNPTRMDDFAVDDDALGFGHLINQSDGTFAIGTTSAENFNIHDSVFQCCFKLRQALLALDFQVREINELGYPDLCMLEKFEGGRIKGFDSSADVHPRLNSLRTVLAQGDEYIPGLSLGGLQVRDSAVSGNNYWGIDLINQDSARWRDDQTDVGVERLVFVASAL